jgi:hydroxyacylglutathione hydrolase
MFLKQYYLGCLAHASYLLGDEASGTGIVVDPQRDIEQYVADAAAHGLAIGHVFLTHFHADFVAGHLELRDRCGATIHLGVRGRAEYAFEGMKTGDALDFPGLRLEVLETPGHTIESISLVVYDKQRNPEAPFAVLTGDTLFIGDVGRPDLRASLGWTAEELGSHLYESVHKQLLPLPDATVIYPAHGAGSLCGKNLSKETVSTMGEQRRYNYALQPMTREQFIAIVTADQPDAPAYFTWDAVLNTRERATLETNLEQALRPIELEEFPGLMEGGGQALDVRHPDEFAAGHLKGSINIGLDGQYATWAGTLLDPKRPILLIAAPGREHEAALRLGRIGFDRVHGYLREGMGALTGRPELLGFTRRLSPPELAAMVDSPQAPLLIDVRTPREWSARHVEGSLNVPLSRLRDEMGEIPRDRLIAVQCAGGYRSSIAASLLQREGIGEVMEVAGGLAAWDAARLPVASTPAA